jgi:hypothetical protein
MDGRIVENKVLRMHRVTGSPVEYTVEYVDLTPFMETVRQLLGTG